MTFEPTAWSCYNWHNLLEQHHKLTPGDLLCIGPSESGKTTVLDAFQVVLTGDTDVQLNSAADPVRGKTELKAEGRNLRKIVLRIEEDGSRLGPDGVNISYFAIELTDHKTGEKIVLALGAKAHSEGQTVDKWWLIARDTPIDEIAFVLVDGDTSFALDKESLRDRNRKSRVLDTGRYRLELVNLLFPILADKPDSEKRAHLEKWAAYLNIAKSYGRMHRADPGELLHDALPEPRLEAFEAAKRAIEEVNVIRQKIVEAQTRLDAMQLARRELGDARQRQTRLHANNYARLKLQHSELVSKAQELQHQLASSLVLAESKKREAASLSEELAQAEEHLKTLDDPEARSIMDAIARKQSEIKQLEEAIKPVVGQLATLREQASSLDKRISDHEKRFSDARNAAYAAIVASSKRFKGALRDAYAIYADAIMAGAAEEITSAHVKADTERSRALTTLVQQEQVHRATARAEDDRRAEFDALAKSIESEKDVAPLRQASESARDLGTRATLVYQGIEIIPGRERDAVLLQEFLGPKVLSAILPSTPELFDHVKRHVHATNPELLVVEIGEVPDFGILTGILQCVDLPRSSPAAVSYLAAIAGDVALLDKGTNRGSAERAVWRDGSVYDGRTWHIEVGSELRYLGERARAAERERRLNEAREGARQAKTLAEAATNKAVALERERLSTENAIREIFDVVARANFEGYRSDLRLWTAELAQKNTLIHELLNDLAAKEARLQVWNRGLEKLLQDADAKGAKDAVAKQTQAQLEVDRLKLEAKKAYGESERAFGQAKARQEDIEALHAPLALANDQQRDARAILSAFANLTSKQADEYLDTEGLTKMDDAGLVTSTSRVSGLLANHKNEIRRLIAELQRQSEDLDFVEEHFIIRETRSGLSLDDRVRTLEAETEQDRRRQVERVRAIQNQQVIEPIGEMLKEDLVNLENMRRDINDHLKRTPFNGRTYTLSREVRTDAPKALVKLIGEYTQSNPEPLREELLTLLSDETKTAQQLQAYFDYRRWFTFQLQRSRPGKGEEFAAASSASGSGGAQAAPHYILTYAMLTMFYRSSQARIWTILLDEAFTRVDAANRFVLYEMAKDLGFIVIAANTEFDGHSRLRRNANILFVKKDLQTFETHIKPWTQEFHAN